jgi:hypothetical protein
MMASVALLIGTPSGSANNDRHRSFAPVTPFDLPAGFCSFPVHFDFPVNKEYQTVSTLPDGSTLSKFTGSQRATVTNQVTGKTVTVNDSGPGSLIVSTDGTAGTVDFQGLTLLYAMNATQYGFPSNVVVTSGRLSITIDFMSSSITSVTRQPHVLTDVCAALS